MGMKIFSKLMLAGLLMVAPVAHAIDIQGIINQGVQLSGGVDSGSVSSTAKVLPYCSIGVTGSPLSLENFKVIQLETGQYIYAANLGDGHVSTTTAGYGTFAIEATVEMTGITFFDGDETDKGTAYVDILDMSETKIGQIVIPRDQKGSMSIDVSSSVTDYKIGTVIIFGGKNGFKDLGGSVELGFTISCGA